MDSAQFDRISRMFASRKISRRAAIATSAAAAAAAASRAVSAQDATPTADTSDSVHPSFLFVQLAADGTWLPKTDEPDVYTLTLSGATGQTLYFSDRPERIVGTVGTDEFFDGLGFTPDNPPNAALVVKTPEGERDVLVIELLNPTYAEAFGENSVVQVTYEARVLEAYSGEGLATWSKEQVDDLLPEQFTDASLFIDNCPDAIWVDCYLKTTHKSIGRLTEGPFPTCWREREKRCLRCDDWDYMCTEAFVQQCEPAGGCLGVGLRIK
jgi:hypothetical protein